jgi:hypothetical protein
MSNGLCHDTCDASYAFAILQGQNCWCSNYIPINQQSTSNCNEPCPGYPSDLCGSSNGLFGYIALNIKPFGTAGASSSIAKSSSVSRDIPPTPTPLSFLSSSSSSSTSSSRPSSSSYTPVVISVSFFYLPVFWICKYAVRYYEVPVLSCASNLLKEPNDRRTCMFVQPLLYFYFYFIFSVTRHGVYLHLQS